MSTLHEVDLSQIEVDGKSQALRGHVAVPEGEGPWPGVVVVFEIFGVDDVMLEHTKHLAELGYLAIMPDLYSDGGARRCVRQAFTEAGSGTGRGVADLEAARSWLAADPRCTGTIGILGFCMGGQFAMVAATKGSFAASAVNYGPMPKSIDLSRSCPMVASYGGLDAGTRGATSKLRTELTKAGVPHDVLDYPQAGHSFLNTAVNGPKAMRPLMKAMHTGPAPVSAEHAWGRIDAFFDTHLRGNAAHTTNTSPGAHR